MGRVKVKYALLKHGSRAGTHKLERIFEATIPRDLVPQKGDQIVLPDSESVRKVVHRRHRYTKTGFREVLLILRPVEGYEMFGS